MSSAILKKHRHQISLSSTNDVLFRHSSLNFDGFRTNDRSTGGGLRASSVSPHGFSSASPSPPNSKRHHRHTVSTSQMGRLCLSPQGQMAMPNVFKSPKRHEGLTKLDTSKPFESLLSLKALTPRSNEALVKIQSHVRSRNAIKQLPLLRHAHRRGAQRRNRMQSAKSKSAIQIQKIFRSHSIFSNRFRIHELRERAAAATELQRHIRGLLTRKGVIDSEQKLVTVLWLQARYRGHKGRVLFSRVLAAKRRAEYEKRKKEEAAMAEANAAAEEKRLARLAAEREAARLRKLEEEEKRKEEQRKEFMRRKAAERERLRKEALAAAAEKKRKEQEEAARLAALAAEQARLAQLAFDTDCELARKLKEEIKAMIEEDTLPIQRLKVALEQYVGIRPDATPHAAEFNDVLKRLRRMEELTEVVISLRHKDISEIRSFAKPPAAILIILRNVYVMLGENPKKLSKWINIAKLLGQKGKKKIQARIEAFRPHTVTPDLARSVEAKIEKFGASVSEIEKINISVSRLYAWLQGTVDIIRSVDIIRNI